MKCTGFVGYNSEIIQCVLKNTVLVLVASIYQMCNA